jgi:fumarate hydratase subunit beta
MEKHIYVPFSAEDAASLQAGDLVYLSGIVYTARDAAHKRMIDTLAAGKPLPIDIKGSVIYYMGPSPAREGRAIGSAGPTTSSRMDQYTPTLLDLGLSGMIGKGKRSSQVKQSMIRNEAVYFAAIGGAGALLSRSIVTAKLVAYEDLGTEAIRRLEIRDFPAIVVIDSRGNDLYETSRQRYQKEEYS